MLRDLKNEDSFPTRLHLSSGKNLNEKETKLVLWAKGIIWTLDDSAIHGI